MPLFDSETNIISVIIDYVTFVLFQLVGSQFYDRIFIKICT